MKTYTLSPFIRKCRYWVSIVVLALTTALLSACGSNASVDEYVASARTAAATGDYRTAVIHLKNALQIDGNNAEARLELGLIYLKVGQGPSAVKELTKAGELGRDSEDVQLALIEAYILSSEFDKALESLALIQVDSQNPAPILLSGEAQLGLKNYDEARRFFQEALEVQPGNFKAQRGLARVALAQRNFSEAEKQLDISLQNPSEELEAWSLMGQLELMRGNFEAALKAYQSAESLGSISPAIRIGLIRSLLALNRPDEADVHVRTLHDASPNHPLINYYRGVSARIQGNMELAEEALREVLRVRANHIQTLLLLGSIKLEQGDLRQAEESLTKFVNAAPEHVPGAMLLAQTYLELGQPAKAVEVLVPLEQSASESARFLGMLGSAYLRDQTYQRGTELLERAARLDPNATDIRAQLAVSHLVTGAPDKAVRELKTVLGNEPGFLRANLLLIFAHLRNQKWDEAIEAARNLSERQPDDPVPLNLLGSAYAGKGENKAAREQFEKALALKADFHSASINLAVLDESEDKFQDAAERYAAVLEMEPGQEQAAVALARLVEQRGDQDETERLLQLARTNNSSSLGPRLVLGNRYLQQGRVEEAARVIDEAERIAPTHPGVIRARARLYMTRGDATRARGLFEQLVEESPDDPQLNFELARAEIASRDEANALERLERVLELAPTHLAARMALAELAIRRGDFNIASEIAAQISEIHPRRSAGPMLQGDALFEGGNARAAIDAYHRALEIEPASLLVTKLFRAYRSVGEMETARQTLQDWLSDNPDDAAIRLVLATSDHSDGSQKTASDAYERVLERAPNNFVALNNLAWVYFERGDERALDLAKRAYDQAGRRPDVADTYGWMLVESGQVERGVKILERAARGAPDQMEIQYHLAAAINKAGDPKRALEILKRVLASEQRFAAKEDARNLFLSLR